MKIKKNKAKGTKKEETKIKKDGGKMNPEKEVEPRTTEAQ